jgi:gephyrin
VSCDHKWSSVALVYDIPLLKLFQLANPDHTVTMANRASKYKMLEVEEALLHVIKETGSSPVEVVGISSCLGLYLAESIEATSNIPAKPTSMMDGYAVKVPLGAGVHRVQAQLRAGDAGDKALEAGNVMYITTGAVLPPGADAVVKVEDTSSPIGSAHVSVTGNETMMNEEAEVNIHTDMTRQLQNVRDVGSDISVGETVLKEGTLISAVEVGLLATIGVTRVKCYKKPVVGVMSTGNELVEPDFAGTLPVGKIRDSNRAALLNALVEDGYQPMDLGIIGDSMATLKAAFAKATSQCDVIITSGGVSMGDADLVKPLLEEMGTVHFGRINMKPGKPTTFATISATDNRSVLFFGLPGNPVSCLVTKALFVDPALRRLQGISSEGALHVQAKATLISGRSGGEDYGEGLKLDTERPEYHRGVIGLDVSTGNVTVQSTGANLNARSSRLLSMQASNAFICLPKAESRDMSVMKWGSSVDVLIMRGHSLGLTPPAAANSVFKKAANYDDEDTAADFSGDGVTRLSSLDDFKANQRREEEAAAAITTPVSSAAAAAVAAENRVMRVGLLTISDRASEGVYEDKSGPTMRDMLTSFCAGDKPWNLDVQIVHSAVVPDEPPLIRNKVCSWCDSGDVDLVLTSGGTGFGIRDVTPETISPLFDRHAPGVAQALLNEGLKHTPLAVLSRPVAGTRNTTFITTLPGSVKAVKENVMALKPLLPRIIELLQSGSCSPPPPP